MHISGSTCRVASSTGATSYPRTVFQKYRISRIRIRFPKNQRIRIRRIRKRYAKSFLGKQNVFLEIKYKRFNNNVLPIFATFCKLQKSVKNFYKKYFESVIRCIRIRW